MNENVTKRSLSQNAGSGLPPFRSLVVPIDLTPSSDRVLGRIPLLPVAYDARVTILHVVPSGLSSGDRRDAERDANKVLAGETRHLRKSLPQHVSVHPVVKLGGAAKEISASAAKMKADLIVMGRGSGAALRDAFLGSTAERVVRQARLPVLVVRLPPRGTYRKPAIALNLDQAAHEVVRLTLAVLAPPRPPVSIIHAYDILYGGLIYPSLADEEDNETKSEFQHQATLALKKLLNSALAKVNLAREDAPVWKTHVRYGSPRIVVKKAIGKAAPDLLVLGTRGHSGAARVFLGTIGGDLLREAKCDVLVVPPASRA